jgi:hypothetical protein
LAAAPASGGLAGPSAAPSVTFAVELGLKLVLGPGRALGLTLELLPGWGVAADALTATAPAGAVALGFRLDVAGKASGTPGAGEGTTGAWIGGTGTWMGGTTSGACIGGTKTGFAKPAAAAGSTAGVAGAAAGVVGGTTGPALLLAVFTPWVLQVCVHLLQSWVPASGRMLSVG